MQRPTPLKMSMQEIHVTLPARHGPGMRVCIEQNRISVLPGFIWTEIKQMWDGGFQDYVHDWWNLMDFVMNSLYLATISLKIVAYTKVTNQLRI